jgi:hypothetical protein
MAVNLAVLKTLNVVQIKVVPRLVVPAIFTVASVRPGTVILATSTTTTDKLHNGHSFIIIHGLEQFETDFHSASTN